MIKQKHQQQQASLKPAAGAPTTADADGLDLQDTAAGLVEAGAGDGDAGNAPPHYVQELYRRYKERVAADVSARKRLGGDGDGGGSRVADGDEEVEDVASREGGGGGGGSLAFVESVVGQLRVRESEREREKPRRGGAGSFTVFPLSIRH